MNRFILSEVSKRNTKKKYNTHHGMFFCFSSQNTYVKTEIFFYCYYFCMNFSQEDILGGKQENKQTNKKLTSVSEILCSIFSGSRLRNWFMYADRFST